MNGLVGEVMTKHPDINEVEPIGPEDEACLAELREVLARHGALGRFGITLLHSHFDMAVDEILVESVDVENRVLTTRPVQLTDSAVVGAIETSWHLDSARAERVCERVCQRPYGPNGPHIPNHMPVS